MTPVEIALSYYGLEEIKGEVDNPKILDMAKSLGLRWYKDDETSWCGIFMGFIHQKCDLEIPDKPQGARNWLKIGEGVSEPNLGDVVIFWRESLNSWKGHVGLFISYSEDKKYINTLGGNQSNRVQISKYKADQLLGFRRIPAKKSKYIQVKAEQLNQRTGPGKKFDLAGKPLAKGEILTIVEEVQEWVRVVREKKTVWVSKKYVDRLPNHKIEGNHDK